MAKNKKNANKQSGKNKSRKQVGESRASFRKTVALDAGGLAYAKLLANPCGGRIVAPVYGDQSSGFLLRTEYDAIMHGGATDTVGMGFFCPANLSTVDGAGSIWTGGGQFDGIAYAIAPIDKGFQPGYGLLQQSRAFRVVSACIQLTYVGSEQARSGVLAVGQSTYDTLNPGSSYAPALLRSMASHVGRVPDGTTELRWVPNASSEEFQDPNKTPSSNSFTQPALFWSVSGLPPGAGIRVRFVVTYEFTWNVTNGMPVGTQTQVSASANTTKEVLNYLAGRAVNWAFGAPVTDWVRAGRAVMPALGM